MLARYSLIICHYSLARGDGGCALFLQKVTVLGFWPNFVLFLAQKWLQMKFRWMARDYIGPVLLPLMGGRVFHKIFWGHLPYYIFAKYCAIYSPTVESTDELSPHTFQFSQSRLDEAYGGTNNLLISPFTDRPITDYRRVVTTLLDNAPPGTDELREETKGEGLLAVYREQITTVFTPLIQTPADLTFIQSLEDYLPRIADDFFSAYKVSSYLSKFGAFTSDKEAQLRND